MDANECFTGHMAIIATRHGRKPFGILVMLMREISINDMKHHKMKYAMV